MCGFAGKVNFNRDDHVERATLEVMCANIAHRGPDENGFFTRKNVGLGHQRLSIIDLSSGRQPLFNEDNSIAVVYNGEIYNFHQLKEELIQKGHIFRTNTDTEVIVHLYEEEGENCLDHFNGMFSFAIWDMNQEKLFLARDRIGIKPLIYYLDNKRIVFGSELKAVTGDKTVPKRINPSAIDLYLGQGYIPAPFTIFENIHKLLPGHYATLQHGVLETTQYWDIKYEYRYDRSDEEDAENILNLLESSVNMRMISDVPLGAFLSGGIDSSSVVGLMSQISGRPKTFSIGFMEEDYNELSDARLVAKAFGTDHYEEIVKPDAISLLDDLVWYYDEPFADASAIPTYYVSKLAREHVKVVLSGDGGDELFAGYLRYIDSDRDKQFLKLPDFIRKNCLGTLGGILPESFKGKNYFQYIAKNEMERYLVKTGCFTQGGRDKLYRKEFASLFKEQRFNYLEKVADMDSITQYLFLDSKTYLPDDILVKVDKASMANSLEARVPILDHRLIEYAATIPPEKKINQSDQKIILKKAVKKLLPEEVFSKKKQGFGVPLEHWFRNELKNFTYDTLLSKKASERGYFNSSQVKYILDEHQAGNRDNSFHIWTLLFLELWHKRFE